MSEKKGEKKSGRNPFNHTRPSRARRNQPEERAKEVVRAKPAIPSVPEPSAMAENGSGNYLFQSNPAWLFVDLWTSALTEPYFFWAKSMDIAKKSMDLR